MKRILLQDLRSTWRVNVGRYSVPRCSPKTFVCFVGTDHKTCAVSQTASQNLPTSRASRPCRLKEPKGHCMTGCSCQNWF